MNRHSDPATPKLDIWSVKSRQFGFSRLRSTDENVGRLPLPDAATDYLLSINLAYLHPYTTTADGIDRMHDPIDEGKICLIPGDRNVSLRVDQPFDLLRFYKTRNGEEQPVLEPLCGHTDSIALNLMKCLLEAVDRPKSVTPAFVHHLGLTLDSHLTSSYATAPRAAREYRGTLAGWQVNLAKEMLAASVGKDVLVSDIAERCGLSTNYFSTAFKNATGKSPLNWQLELRIERARNLLVDTADTLLAISDACGFADQSHFTRIFARVVGLPPGKWRLQQRSGVSPAAYRQQN